MHPGSCFAFAIEFKHMTRERSTNLIKLGVTAEATVAIVCRAFVQWKREGMGARFDG